MKIDSPFPEIDIKVDHENELICASVAGIVDMATGEGVISRVRLQASKYNYAIFYDLRECDFRIEQLDWYYIVEMLSTLEKQQGKSFQVALLVSDNGLNAGVEYYARGATEAGMLVKIFYSYDVALEWLTMDTSIHVRKIIS